MADTQPCPPGLLCRLLPCGVGDRTLFWVMWQGSKGCVKRVGPLSDGKMHFYHRGPKRCSESKYIPILLHTGGRRLERDAGDGHCSLHALPHSASPGWTMGKLLPAVRGNRTHSSWLETATCGTRQHHLHPPLPPPAPVSAHQQPPGMMRKCQPRTKMLPKESMPQAAPP